MKEVHLSCGMVLMVTALDDYGESVVLGVFSEPNGAREVVEKLGWIYEYVRVDEIAVDEITNLNLSSPDTNSPMGAGLWHKGREEEEE